MHRLREGEADIERDEAGCDRHGPAREAQRKAQDREPETGARPGGEAQADSARGQAARADPPEGSCGGLRPTQPGSRQPRPELSASRC